MLRVSCTVDDAERFSVMLLDKYPSGSREYSNLRTLSCSVCAFRVQVKQEDGSIIMQLVIVWGKELTMSYTDMRGPHYT
jgi:hypothetical protein